MMYSTGSASITAILVGLVIALFVLSALLTSTMHIQDSHRKQQQGIMVLKAKHDFLSRYLHEQISQTAYRNLPSNINMPEITDDFPSGFIEATNNTSDSLTYRFIGDGQYMRGCDGLVVTNNSLSTNTLSISGNILMCNGSNLISDIENMQILLGEDTDADKVPNRYVSPDFAGLDTNNITAIRLALLMRTPENVRDNNTTRSYELFGNTIEASDLRQRQVLYLTIPIRSMQR